MPERAQPPQDGRHQPPHQGAVAVGQRFQSGMGGGAVELVVEGAALVQHAVQNIRRDPPRREAGHLGGRCESYRRHKVLIAFETTAAVRRVRRVVAEKSSVPREYAKCKNRPGNFTVRICIYVLTFVC